MNNGQVGEGSEEPARWRSEFVIPLTVTVIGGVLVAVIWHYMSLERAPAGIWMGLSIFFGRLYFIFSILVAVGLPLAAHAENPQDVHPATCIFFMPIFYVILSLLKGGVTWLFYGSATFLPLPF